MRDDRKADVENQIQVSDLTWRGVKDYDQTTGTGAVGVEFASTAVSSTGQSGPIEPVAGDSARGNVQRNPELMWQEGYYRGYFHLRVTPEKAEAQFFGNIPPPVFFLFLLISTFEEMLTFCRLAVGGDAECVGAAPGQLYGP